MMDDIIYELFGSSQEPMDLAIRFFFLILMMDGIFGIASTVLRPLLDKR